MTTEKMMSLAQRIVKESLTQIKYLIDNADDINKYTEGMVDLSNLEDYRSGVTLVYMAGLNTGVLEHTTLDHIFMFLDKGFFKESMLDVQVSCMNYLSKIKN